MRAPLVCDVMRAPLVWQANVMELRAWASDHPWVGAAVRRFFPAPAADGTRPLMPFDGRITGWLPPDEDDCALWHMEMDDGAHLPCISPASPLHLPCISPVSPLCCGTWRWMTVPCLNLPWLERGDGRLI